MILRTSGGTNRPSDVHDVVDQVGTVKKLAIEISVSSAGNSAKKK